MLTLIVPGGIIYVSVGHMIWEINIDDGKAFFDRPLPVPVESVVLANISGHGNNQYHQWRQRLTNSVSARRVVSGPVW